MMVYSIPIDLAINSVREETGYKINLVKNPPKEPLRVKDGRYKSGYRTTEAGRNTQTKLCCFVIFGFIFLGLAFATFGIALIGLIPLYLYYRKQSQKKQAYIEEVQKQGSNIINSLQKMKSQGYHFVCRRCFSSVKLNQAPKTKLGGKTSLKTDQIFCEVCGAQNRTDQHFCINCGSELRIELVKSTNEDLLIEKCESPIEKQFFKVARKFIPDIKPQEWVGKYRVDFLINDKKVVVELDGHEYHKTKNQRTGDAERQRYLQKNGYKVVRFTGTEIHKDVGGCVTEVMELLENKES
jgi:very-short-patch-repair endonuclease